MPFLLATFLIANTIICIVEFINCIVPNLAVLFSFLDLSLYNQRKCHDPPKNLMCVSDKNILDVVQIVIRVQHMLHFITIYR